MRRKFGITLEFVNRLVFLEDKVREQHIDDLILSEVSSIYAVG